MSKKPEFARIIDREARAALAPLGVVQKGRSRTWLDDHVWWVVVVEFQPSKTGNASFLNVGACWLTYAKDYLSFDLGDRVREAVEFRNASQFSDAIREYAQLAVDRVTELRRSITSPADALKRIVEKMRGLGVHDWERYHGAVFAGLSGDLELARRLFREVLADPPTYPWQQERAQRAAQLISLDGPAFCEEIAKTVVETRARLKLPPATGRIF